MDTPPPSQDMEHEWAPFEGKNSYRWAHLEFVRKCFSRDEINEALGIWANTFTERMGKSWAPFADVDDMYATIDRASLGKCTWFSFDVTYTGEDRNNPGAPLWKRAPYRVYTRNTREALTLQLASSDLKGHYDYVATQDFTQKPNGDWEQKYSNLMTADWAWKKSVSMSGFQVTLLRCVLMSIYRTNSQRILS
jgi:hypothetical protein